MSSDNSQKLREVHQRARLFVDRVQTALRDERLQCLKDRRFATIAGAQWEGPLGEQFENKPRFEMNKVHLAVIRIINEYRNNRIDVDFTSEDGSDNDQLADACDGLYRADEQDSGAQEAFDNAFEEGVTGGFGAIRLRTCYVDDEDEDDTRQRIEIVGITDADSCVFFDLDAKRQDKKDAMRAVVLTGMTPDAYREEFDDSPASWPKEIHQSEFDWSTPDVVYVAEYYEIEKVSEKVYFFRGMALTDEPNEIRLTEAELKEEGKAEELAATGFKLSRTKTVKRQRCHKYIMSGSRVLDDCGLIAGRSIPLAPFYGKRWVVDGVERCMGHVRLAKDAQMLTNMLMSWLAEMAARFDMEKPILTPEQVLGHAQMWADDNIKKFPYLLINPITDASGAKINSGPIGYTKAPQLPPVMAGLMQLAEQSLQDLLGNQQAGEQLQANVSAKAVELVQNKLDMQVFIYMSNFAKCVKRVGEIWLEMARDVYVEDGRKMKSVSKEGKTGSLELYRPSIDQKTGGRVLENDLAGAKFDVNVDVGPSSSSKRAATVRALTGLLQMAQDPETRTVLEAMAMVNMEGEGMGDAKDYFHRKLVRLGAAKPTDEEAEAMAKEQENQQPDANTVYLQAAAQKQQADAIKSGKDADLTEAKIGQTHADTIATLAGVEQAREQHAVDLMNALLPQEQPEIQQQAEPAPQPGA
ncbi:MAG: portal protein [Pseudomonadota bacterium]